MRFLALTATIVGLATAADQICTTNKDWVRAYTPYPNTGDYCPWQNLYPTKGTSMQTDCYIINNQGNRWHRVLYATGDFDEDGVQETVYYPHWVQAKDLTRDCVGQIPCDPYSYETKCKKT